MTRSQIDRISNGEIGLLVHGDLGTAFLVCEDGDKTLTKKIDRGAFLLPTAEPDGSPVVSMRRSALSKLFR